MKTLLRLLAVSITGLMLSGCFNSTPVRDPDYAPARPVVPPPAQEGTGSIYQEGYARAWFEDLRARQVGDMLTVALVEQTNASKRAATATSKTNSNSITNPTLFGSTPQFNVPGFIPLASNKNNSMAFDLRSSNEFAGTGDSSQSNNLSGDITVTVTEVLPNGNLLVRGEKRIGINQGNEYIRLSGIVRPHDIDTTNTVLSTKLADPTIVYSGEGALADNNVTGWLSRFFTSVVSPF